ncbi:Ni/Co efflux regulator RcnB [Pseudomonas duriflava]|uniref:Ni/Co efflux regulator RcnB n=1 Tax=Pseudomonas duriflava TaxID=459528 RepID=A0A562Q6V4_9PSED|nr:RcnB family protein [Pseudomonas duriflava]TWI52467.1 Ni/Co efflux regulator RcnB [Pseudomonas duriflava]
MNIKALTACLLLGTSLASTGVFAQDAAGKYQPSNDKYQDSVISKDKNQKGDLSVIDPTDGNVYEIGSEAPDKYQRDVYRIKDPKAHGLKEPEEDQQWVKIGRDYVLLKTTSSAIVEIVKGKDE